MNNLLKYSLFVIALVFQPIAHAGFDEGVKAYKNGDYKTAFKEWKPLAEQGDATAQYNLGLMFANGEGVAQDYKQSVSWFSKAAEQGVAEAQYNLGVTYAKGRGVAQDYKQVVSWGIEKRLNKVLQRHSTI